MSEGQAPRPSWLAAVLPLGVGEGNAWKPAGVGVLLLEREVLWLATLASVVAKAGQAGLVTWPMPGLSLHLDDLPDQGLEWIPHSDYDLAVRIFPADPAWNLRAFGTAQCAGVATVEAGQPALTAGFPYALAAGETPRPMLLDGVIASIDEPGLALVSTAPVLPRCLGSPLLVRGAGEMALAGLVTRRVWLPQDEEQLPAQQLTVSLSASALVGLIRSPAALDRTKRASRAVSG